MTGLDKKETNDFIRCAEAKNIQNSKGALRGIEEYLDKNYWLSECESTVDYYYCFHDVIKSITRYLLVNYRMGKPDILNFIIKNKNEISKEFSIIKTKGATYAHMSITLRYLMSEIWLKILSNNNFHENEKLVQKVLQALWHSYETDKYANPEEIEQWQAYSVLFKLAYGKYDEIIQDYEELFNYELAKYENSRRTLIKECYMLSKIAIDDYDSDLLFGANSYVSLLKYQFYLWRVNDDLSAEIELVPLLVVVYLHRVIVDKSIENPFKIFSSMQPKTVLEEMILFEEK